MLKRIGSNGWWLIRWYVDAVLSAWFPVKEFAKPTPCEWAKYEYQNLDPYRPLEAFGSWAGNVKPQHPAVRNWLVIKRRLVAA